MKILKLLSKILILFIFTITSSIQALQAEEIKEFWNVIGKNESNSQQPNIENDISNEGNQPEEVKLTLSDENILVDQNLDNSNILLAGLIDPAENDLNLEMWSNTNGSDIKKMLKNIQSKELSSFSEKLMDVALLTNSYVPNQNFSLNDFENFTLDHLIKKKILNLLKNLFKKTPR